MFYQIIGLCRRDLLSYRGMIFRFPLFVLLFIAFEHFLFGLISNSWIESVDWIDIDSIRHVTINDMGHMKSLFVPYLPFVLLFLFVIHWYYFADVYYNRIKEKTDYFWRTFPISPIAELVSKYIVAILIVLISVFLFGIFDLFDFLLDKALLLTCPDCTEINEKTALFGAYLANLVSNMLAMLIFAGIVLFSFLPLYTAMLLLSTTSKIHPIWILIVYFVLAAIASNSSIEHEFEGFFIIINYIIYVFEAVGNIFGSETAKDIIWPYSFIEAFKILLSSLLLAVATVLSRTSRQV